MNTIYVSLFFCLTWGASRGWAAIPPHVANPKAVATSGPAATAANKATATAANKATATAANKPAAATANKPAATPNASSVSSEKKATALVSDSEILRSNRDRLLSRQGGSSKSNRSTLIFDLPLTYNQRVSYWIQFFQTRGKNWFGEWLEKSTKYMPMIQKELKAYGVPQDLAFMVMIESGFDSGAKSHAGAVGPWQFIQTTGERYGLRVTPWLDERKDLKKSTLAAIRYIRDLHEEFGSWYLVAASYNMGENGLRRQIQKHKTRDFWQLSHLGALPKETIDYVPKILAAMIIAKSPTLYGFSKVPRLEPLEFDLINVPGGTDLNLIADYLGVTRKHLRDLNTELLQGYVPSNIKSHRIRIPKGSVELVAKYTGTSTESDSETKAL